MADRDPRPMKVYLTGPMTGYPEFNYPAFEEAAKVLRAAGVEVVSPHEVNPADGVDRGWDWYLRRDIVALVDCNAVVRLPGSDDSKGSRLECYIAAALGMRQYELADVLSEVAS